MKAQSNQTKYTTVHDLLNILKDVIAQEQHWVIVFAEDSVAADRVIALQREYCPEGAGVQLINPSPVLGGLTAVLVEKARVTWAQLAMALSFDPDVVPPQSGGTDVFILCGHPDDPRFRAASRTLVVLWAMVAGKEEARETLRGLDIPERERKALTGMYEVLAALETLEGRE